MKINSVMMVGLATQLKRTCMLCCTTDLCNDNIELSGSLLPKRLKRSYLPKVFLQGEGSLYYCYASGMYM